MTEACLECGAEIAGEMERFCSRVCGAKWLSAMLQAAPAVAADRLDEELCAEDAPASASDSASVEPVEVHNRGEIPKGRKCTRCGERFTIDRQGVQGRQERHHIIPRAAGGPDHPLNLVNLCHECHTKAHREMKRLPEEKPELLVELRDFVCTP